MMVVVRLQSEPSVAELVAVQEIDTCSGES